MNLIVGQYKIINIVSLIMILCCMVALPFFPLLSFILSILYLIFISSYNLDFLRILISLVSYFSLIVILGSKTFHNELDMDLSVYLNVYDYISVLSLNELWKGSFIGEPGWVTLYWLLNKFGFHVNGVQLAILNSFISIAIFVLWFERFGIKFSDYRYRGIVTASTILFMSVVSFGFLQRQSISVAILLFALSNRNNNKFFLFLILSSFFHLSSLVVGLIYKVFLNRKINDVFWLYFFIFCVSFRLIFPIIISIILVLLPFPVLTYKLGFYSEITNFQIVSFRIALYGMLFSIVTFFMSCNLDDFYKNLVRFCSVVFLSMLGINLFSERFNFILLYCFGYFISLMLVRKYFSIVMVMCLLLLGIFIYEKGVSDLSLDPYWQRYPYISNSFFYYLSKM